MKDITIEEAVEILNKAQKVLTGNDTDVKLNFEDTAKAIEKVLNELEKKDKIIDATVEEMTDCEFEMKCSECTYECEKDYDQLYECNKQYFERKVENE